MTANYASEILIHITRVMETERSEEGGDNVREMTKLKEKLISNMEIEKQYKIPMLL